MSTSRHSLTGEEGISDKDLPLYVNEKSIPTIENTSEDRKQQHDHRLEATITITSERVRASKTVNELGAMLLYTTILAAVLIYCNVVDAQNSKTNKRDGSTIIIINGSEDFTQYVNIWLGTQNGGNDNPAATRPFGMVKLGPDLYVDGTDAYSGYLPNGNFSGFSMMHEQGTGGAPKYGTVAQLPLVGSNISQPLSNLTIGRSGTDQGSVGYYKAVTSQEVIVELAASDRAGMFRYTFPSKGNSDTSDGQNNILVDVSHVLPSYRGLGTSQYYAGGSITVYEDGHYEGHGVYKNGWNLAPDWPIYFCKLCSSYIYIPFI